MPAVLWVIKGRVDVQHVVAAIVLRVLCHDHVDHALPCRAVRLAKVTAWDRWTLHPMTHTYQAGRHCTSY